MPLTTRSYYLYNYLQKYVFDARQLQGRGVSSNGRSIYFLTFEQTHRQNTSHLNNFMQRTEMKTKEIYMCNT